MIVLDTQALVWLDAKDTRLGDRARTLADMALDQDELVVSAISFCEIAALVAERRLKIDLTVTDWRMRLLEGGLREWPVDGEVAIRAVELRGFHKDPGDRLIVATALVAGALLITSDAKILAWPGPLRRIDARL